MKTVGSGSDNQLNFLWNFKFLIQIRFFIRCYIYSNNHRQMAIVTWNLLKRLAYLLKIKMVSTRNFEFDFEEHRASKDFPIIHTLSPTHTLIYTKTNTQIYAEFADKAKTLRFYFYCSKMEILLGQMLL